MKKRIISVILVLCMFLGIFASQAAALNINFGYFWGGNAGLIKAADAKGQAVSTEYLYGTRDYLRFHRDSGIMADVIYCVEIYPDKEFKKEAVAAIAFTVDGKQNDISVPVDTGMFPKNGTYYAAAYFGELEGDDLNVDYKTVIQFKIVVDKSTSDIRKQTVVTAFASTLNGPKIKWYGIKGAKNYYVYRKAKAGDPWKRIATVGSGVRNYTDKSAAAKTGTYIYTVKAVNAGGTASKFQAIDYTYVAPVKTVKAAETSDNTVNVSWSKAAGVSGYIVYRKTAGSGWKRLATIDSASTVKYADSSVKKNGEKYTYTVKAFKRLNGELYYASYISGTAITFVAAPKLEAPVAVENGVKLSWKKVAGAKEYTVYRSPIVQDDGKASWKKLAAVPASTLSYIDKTASLNGSYSYTVRAEGAQNRGSYEGNGKAYFPAPVIKTFSETADNAVLLKWKSLIPDEKDWSTYECFLYRKTSDGEWERINTYGDRDALLDFCEGKYTDASEKVNGETYSYKLELYNIIPYNGDGDYITGECREVVLSLQFIAAPELLSAEADGENVKITWAPVEGAASYNIYRKSADSDGWGTSIGNVTAGSECSFVDTSAAANESYIYTVRSEGAQNRGSYSGAGITYTPAQQVIAE